ncbi:MAG TPA: hypothetical protein VJV79_32110 [Polyangiaceae bacterium]|nr:hypothetical protein [Polyangiaceae bacterium]
MIRYYARLNAAQAPQELLNREGVVKLNDFGAQLGFGVSVLRQREFFQGESGVPPTPEVAQPLLTWPFLDFIEHLDLSGQSLIELGAGFSTIWLSKRFGKVRSFETNPEWHAAVGRNVASNVELSLVPLAQLESGQLEYRGEQWLLVDFAGKRTAFLNHFLSQLTAAMRPAAIVLDNSDWYRRGAQLLRQHGYLELPFYGFKSGQSWISCTSLFIEPARFAPTQKDRFFQPAFSRDMHNSWDEV